MSNYMTGLSGLRVAQQMLEIVGTNIANATTPGYHRQDPQVASVSYQNNGQTGIGGVEISEVHRAMDLLVEREMLRQSNLLGQVSQELYGLGVIESALGQIGSQNLSSQLDAFLSSVQSLAAQPTSAAMREQVIWTAQGLTDEFRSLSGFLTDMQQQAASQVEAMVNEVNALSQGVATSNQEISAVVLTGGNTNLLEDRRDQAIMELGELLGVEALANTDFPAVRDVRAVGSPLVLNSRALPLEHLLGEAGTIAVRVQGALQATTDVDGGKIGGLLWLTNTYIPQLQQKLDTLAGSLISAMNDLHVEGVGLGGSFTSLTGGAVTGETLDAWSATVQAGSFKVRIIDQATGAIVHETIPVDPSVETVNDVCARLDALDHLSASVTASSLRLQAEDGYRFDFLTAVDDVPTTSTITGTSEVGVDGLYVGDTDEVYTATVSGSGRIGLANPLSITVRDSDNTLVRTLNVGSGYAAGDRLELAAGLWITLTDGTLNAGDTFTIEATATNDSSGFLSAAGMNTFFEGAGASDITVCRRLRDDQSLLATAIGTAMSDSANVERMLGRISGTMDALGGSTVQEYYQQFVASVGQTVQSHEIRSRSLTDVMAQLESQRDAVAGVDVNEEAAKLMMFQQMYQAMAKVVSTQSKSLDYLMELL